MIGSIHGPRGISSWEVEKATGRDWDEWLEILDEWQGERKGFGLIMRYLMTQYKLPYYWAQAVAVHYVWKRMYDHVPGLPSR